MILSLVQLMKIFCKGIYWVSTGLGEFNNFLGLQVNQLKEGIFISQAKYIKEFIKKFGMETSKEASTPISSISKLDKDKNGSNIDQTLCKGMIKSCFIFDSKEALHLVLCMCLHWISLKLNTSKFRHHSIRKHVLNNVIILENIPMENLLANICIKPLDLDKFALIKLGLYDLI